MHCKHELRIGKWLRERGVGKEAIADGVGDVRGYFHWSLMDNFEWVSGYQPMFGLYSLKPGTKPRKTRRDARFYAGIVRDGTVPQRYRDRFP